jgi:16S rRNA A1518/A1519 N6-dimethyltransferase RsmA/KsgA/DIM1 with predicted DNA glycosylase/AP lyase activity
MSASSSSRPNIRHSQNFLHDPALVTRLLDKCDLRPDDVVYEIGPGKGMLTEQLARRGGRVVAIEKDPCLAEQLARRFAELPNVTIHRGDFLDYHLPRAPYKVVANIPFNITADIVTRLTSAACPPDDAYLVMQREAANTLLGVPRASLRATLLAPWFEREIVYRFRRADFIPAPRVDVVMLRMRKRGPPLVSRRDEQCFRDLVVYSFTAWRPTIGSTLSSIFTSSQLRNLRRELGLDLDLTPASIPFAHWLQLFEYFKVVRNDRTTALITGSEQRLLRQQARLPKIHRTRAHRSKKT